MPCTEPAGYRRFPRMIYASSFKRFSLQNNYYGPIEFEFMMFLEDASQVYYAHVFVFTCYGYTIHITPPIYVPVIIYQSTVRLQIIRV